MVPSPSNAFIPLVDCEIVKLQSPLQLTGHSETAKSGTDNNDMTVSRELSRHLSEQILPLSYALMKWKTK